MREVGEGKEGEGKGGRGEDSRQRKRFNSIDTNHQRR